MLQVVGLGVASWSAFMLHPSAGGLVLSTGLLIFGLALEKSGD